MSSSTETLTMLDLADVFDAPFNPRKIVTEEYIAELAQSIEKDGQQFPIIVRPAAEDRFECIAGSCRLKALRKLGREQVKAIVRDDLSDDADAERVALIENLQRNDLHPMDEATALDRAVTIGTKAGVPFKEICDGIGKPPTYIAQRLKLLDLIPEAEKAFATNKIELGHALLLARFTPEIQKQGLKAVLTEGGYVGNTRDSMSPRALSAWLSSNALTPLAKAPFDTEDATLLPEAGACGACPKNTANKPNLFEGEKGKQCSDVRCYKLKVAAHVTRTKQELVEKLRADEKAEQEKETEEKPAKGKKAAKAKAEPKKVPVTVIELTTEYAYQRPTKGPLPYNHFKVLPKGAKECAGTRQGIWINGDKVGNVERVCIDPKCSEKHWGLGFGGDAPTRRKMSEKERDKAKAERDKQRLDDLIAKAEREELVTATAHRYRNGSLSIEAWQIMAGVFFERMYGEGQYEFVRDLGLIPVDPKTGKNKGRGSYREEDLFKKYVAGFDEAELIGVMARITSYAVRFTTLNTESLLPKLLKLVGVDRAKVKAGVLKVEKELKAAKAKAPKSKAQKKQEKKKGQKAE